MVDQPNLVKRIIQTVLVGAIGLVHLLVPSTAQASWSPLLPSPFWWFARNEAPKQANKPTPQPPKPTQKFLPRLVNKIIPEAEAMSDKQIVAAWLTPWGDDSYQSFINNLDTITEIHPFVYTIGADGVSVIPDEGDWHKAEVLRLASQYNIKVLPTISADVNYSDLMLNDPALRTAHIDQIMAVIKANNYDGFDIDYEGFLNGYNREVYALFMKELGARIHAENKLLGIAIEAFNTEQDWESLGAAVDRFEIMGYDYHAAKTAEVGPIGPASWLSDVIDYAAKRVPKEKIVLGLGTYGYSWIANGSQFVSTAVGYNDAIAIADELQVPIQHDAEQTPYFSYNRGEGQRYLYFEDAASTKPKLELAKKTGIAGVAFWRLGTEDPKLWGLLK